MYFELPLFFDNQILFENHKYSLLNNNSTWFQIHQSLQKGDTPEVDPISIYLSVYLLLTIPDHPYRHIWERLYVEYDSFLYENKTLGYLRNKHGLEYLYSLLKHQIFIPEMLQSVKPSYIYEIYDNNIRYKRSFYFDHLGNYHCEAINISLNLDDNHYYIYSNAALILDDILRIFLYHDQPETILINFDKKVLFSALFNFLIDYDHYSLICYQLISKKIGYEVDHIQSVFQFCYNLDLDHQVAWDTINS